MNLSEKTWLLIDFDNTMMATEQYAIPSLIARFNALYGEQIDSLLTYEIFKQHFHGQARQTLCQNLSEYYHIHVDYPTLYDSREWRMMQHLQKVPDGIEMAPHLIESLTLLAKRQIGFALVSNNPIMRALTAMRFAQNHQGEQLASFFGTHFFEAGEIQKPRPDVYLRAMEQLNTTPENCFAVEDSVTGATSSIAAGITTFGFVGFAQDSEQAKQALFKAGCLAVFNDWHALPDCLEKTMEFRELIII